MRAALMTPWSNAQVESQVTKLKLIKQLMYCIYDTGVGYRGGKPPSTSPRCESACCLEENGAASGFTPLASTRS